MRRFIGKYWGKAEKRASPPPPDACARQATDETGDEPMPGGRATTPQPDAAALEARSDYGALLRENVPSELKRIAMRRAWASDPAIASFKGFADYDWDANAAGYGWLRPSDAAMAVATVLGQSEPQPEGDEVVVAEAQTLDEAEERVSEDHPVEDENPNDRSSA